MAEKQRYKVLLYYKFVKIDDFEEFTVEHKALCEKLQLKGRVLIAKEGINGILSGPSDQTDAYMEKMHSDPRFKDMVFKIDEADGYKSPHLKVKARDEVLTFRLNNPVEPEKETGNRLSPEAFYEALQDEDVIVLDGRNDYEYEIGHFRGAIRPDVKSFREFPKWIKENLSEHKDKKIISYCTGGIRCEKLTAYMKREGFKDVNQLDGGIVTYGKHPEVKGQLWDGKCYVFDDRISVPINQVEDKVISTCYHCGQPEDRYINCANPECNIKHVCCTECEVKHKSSCSVTCEDHPRNRYVLAQEENNQQQAI